MNEQFHIHLISDSTGETTLGVLKASIVQFEGVAAQEHIWPMVRSSAQMEQVIEGIRQNPGPVIFTLVSTRTRQPLIEQCARMNIPCVSVLDPIIECLGNYLNRKTVNRPGGQHTLNAEYFDRIEALNYVMAHDDGQAAQNMTEADLVLIGVSRTSKTPTSVYLANHYGLKTANVPFVPGIQLPNTVFELGGTFIVGLTASPARLVQIRRNRLLMLNQEPKTAYVDIANVKAEIAEARKLFSRHAWPVIDVTRRSIEETAAAIFQLYTRFRDEQGGE
ncbi:MAG: pyruvate, water dikinase regulatory protein [Pseudomonadota bacterium]|nr:pyruvate, water dikinase regulatory protein [Pseudomonadota bacterium]MEC8530974.1 pyruvate, water dikinase regulatory protein [Pseudomonadota bacterium]MEC8725334.1 pyruvate, water dikinase regulatory protein [Pseudomonadota bacterium]